MENSFSTASDPISSEETGYDLATIKALRALLREIATKEVKGKLPHQELSIGRVARLAMKKHVDLHVDMRNILGAVLESTDHRLYDEVERDLAALEGFKTIGQVLSSTREANLQSLGLLRRQPPTYPAAPVPEQDSITVDTPKDLLNLKPEVLLAPDSSRNEPSRKSDPGKIGRVPTTGPKKGEKIAVMKGDHVQVVSAEKYPLVPFETEKPEVPRLSHDLSRVLFNPGVYHLQDPRSRVWNFDPYLGNLMPVSEFNYDALNKYITSSEDTFLRDEARKRDKRYIGSTSSMSGVLAHFHFLLSAFRPLNLRNLSRGFGDEGHANFTRIQRGPTAIFLRYKDGVYAVDADKEYDSANILMSLGRSMEKLLTSDKEEFERFRRTEDAAKDAEVRSSQPEAYHYSGLGQFLLRSQLDAHDPRLPGTGMFDLKTRAVAAVRMMVWAHEKGVGYQIKDRFGTWESYEREYFDMMRSAFLKYSLQVRMGRMDGIFVAYHNTERLFGFQYVPLTEMDFALHGQTDRTLGDQEFSLSIQMLNQIFNEATMAYPGESLRFHFETREATQASPQYTYVFAEPVTEDEIVAIQSLKKEEIRAFEERIFNPKRGNDPERFEEGDGEAELDNHGDEVESTDRSIPSDQPGNTLPVTHQSNAANVEFLDSILGLDLKEALAPKPQEASEKIPEAASMAKGPPPESAIAPPPAPRNKPLLGWKINIRNMINGMPVVRPENLKGSDTWSLQYDMRLLPPPDALRQYILCKNRRKATLEAPQDADEAANFYLNKLIKMSRSGAQWRKLLDKEEAKGERVVLYDD